jgi:hypothetical protein
LRKSVLILSCVPLSTNGNIKGRKTFSLEGKLKILQDVEKHVGTRVSLRKQVGILVSTANTIVKNHNIIDETANQCRPMVKK